MTIKRIVNEIIDLTDDVIEDTPLPESKRPSNFDKEVWLSLPLDIQLHIINIMSNENSYRDNDSDFSNREN